MERKYIALALIGLIGCAGLVSAGVIGVEVADGCLFGMGAGATDTTGSENTAGTGAGDGPCPGNGPWLRNQMHTRLQEKIRDRMMHRHELMEQRQMQHGAQLAENYLNLTRLGGILAYDNETETYTIDGTVVYLGDEFFLASLARSDYNQDGSYEYIWEELQGLVGSDIVVNGVIDGDTVYASHVNGIWLRIPREVTMVEIDGVLEYINGSYLVDGVELLVPWHRMSRSDIDGDGMLERLKDELDGLVGEQVSVDGADGEHGLLVMHVNGISVR